MPASFYNSEGQGAGLHAFGAEHVVPWFIDSCFVSIRYLKKVFSSQELAALVALCENADGDAVPSSHKRFLLDIVNGKADGQKRTKDGTDYARLGKKVGLLDEVQSAALLLWACAFWRSPSAGKDNLERYVSAD